MDPPPGPVSAAAKICSKETVEALKTQARMSKARDDFVTAMEEKVFCRKSAADVKELSVELGKKHQELMRGADFMGTVALVWKESVYVTDDELDRAGLERTFELGRLNAHAVGLAFAKHKGKVNAATQKVSQYVAMATAYGLIEPIQTNGKSIELRGTELLHEVMLAQSATSPKANPTPAVADSSAPRTY